MTKLFAKLLTFKALKTTAFMALFAVSAFAVSAGSEAAFTGQTDNTGNSWTTGSVTLRDNDLGNSLFTATGIVPGYTQSSCIVVISDSAATTSLFMTGAGTSGGGLLQDTLNVTVEAGTGAQAGCGDFVPGSVVQSTESLTAFQDGTTTTPLALGQLAAGGGSKTFRITVALPSDQNSPDLQNKLVSYDFLWFNQA